MFWEAIHATFQARAEQEQLINEFFDKILPKFTAVVEPIAAKGEWIAGPTLTMADFWIGGLYTNFINNPNITFAKDKWAGLKDTYPGFKAYGEKFTAEVQKRIDSRGQYPF